MPKMTPDTPEVLDRNPQSHVVIYTIQFNGFEALQFKGPHPRQKNPTLNHM